MSLGAEIELDALVALIAAAKAYETEILDFATAQLTSGENSVAAALEAGFRAKVPLAGGSIGAAIGTAITQLEAEQTADLKTAYDVTIVRLEAVRDKLAAGG